MHAFLRSYFKVINFHQLWTPSLSPTFACSADQPDSGIGTKNSIYELKLKKKKKKKKEPFQGIGYGVDGQLVFMSIDR